MPTMSAAREVAPPVYSSVFKMVELGARYRRQAVDGSCRALNNILCKVLCANLVALANDDDDCPLDQVLKAKAAA